MGLTSQPSCHGKILLICNFWNIRCIILNFSPRIMQRICVFDALCVCVRPLVVKVIAKALWCLWLCTLDVQLFLCLLACWSLSLCPAVFRTCCLSFGQSHSSVLTLHIFTSCCVTSLPEDSTDSGFLCMQLLQILMPLLFCRAAKVLSTVVRHSPNRLLLFVKHVLCCCCCCNVSLCVFQVSSPFIWAFNVSSISNPPCLAPVSVWCLFTCLSLSVTVFSEQYQST